MWRRACPILIAIFAVALVLTRRRLCQVESDELNRARGEAGHAMESTGTQGKPGVAAVGSDLSSEWEQGVPPMDS
jgi:hypothetical protein